MAQTKKAKANHHWCSLNLFEHPVAEIRAIADEVNAKVMFDAAH